ncbi:MAG: hypothetical protein MUO23_15440, partial [Anaerolineales bacterium]|nr:hypothetical protein [Anaerolineales bacterium]
RQGGGSPRPRICRMIAATLRSRTPVPRLPPFALALVALAAVGCTPAESPVADPRGAISTPTATTPSPPSLTPSPSASPAPPAPVPLGEMLLSEAFDDRQGWELEETVSGAASLVDGRLVLSARKPSTSILQPAPHDPLGDFYAEVEVRSEVCSPGDEYGLVIRLSPSGEHYRVSLLCEGSARLLRVLADQTNALTATTPSGSVIPGPAGLNWLAVSAQGSQLRVFVNHQPVLEDRDSRLSFGRLGFFARPGAGGQTTVAFDNLAVYALAATPTSAP